MVERFLDAKLTKHDVQFTPQSSKFNAMQKRKNAVNTTSKESLEGNSFENESNPISASIMYGLINTVILLPVEASFGHIIYGDEFFKPYLPVLVKLTLISALVHQACFSMFSSLPFAVGQVQDAGLIFLSSIASGIVKHCRDRGHDVESTLATVTVGLSLCTAILGVALVILAKLKVASVVKNLPTPVVGGYLAFIGFFCGQNGLAMMANVEVKSLFEQLFKEESLKLMLPGLIGGCLMFFLVKVLRHMAVLPTLLVIFLAGFYSILSLTNTSFEEATNNGWLTKGDVPPPWYKTYEFLHVSKVVWSAMPPQVFTLIAMIIVVALSSSLDVAAIELELHRPLNYDRELETVGISNIISGLTGGYTGSYIFSQTIFYMRAGIRSRLAGYVVVIAELIAVILPFPILSYVPNFFFGSLLIMICVDLMYEWLWCIREKVKPASYAVAILTFLSIGVINVTWGLLSGIVLYYILMKFGIDVGDVESDESLDEETEPICNSEKLCYGGVNGIPEYAAEN